MTLKVVPIQSKMKEPTLTELLAHDEAKFQELVNEVLDKYLPYDGQQASFLTPEDE